MLLDEDTRGRVGNKDIVRDVLDKIERCDIFLADLTPVTSMYKDVENNSTKLLPNSNVMFEYGYAFHCKGENRMISLARLESDEHVENLPFDINHNTLTTFKDANGLKHLVDWIRNIIKDIDKERVLFVPAFDCSLSFTDNLSEKLAIHPKFKKTVYGVKRKGGVVKTQEKNNTLAQVLNPSKHLYEIAQSINKFYAPTVIKPVSQKTNNSYCAIMLSFFNKGTTALENCNLRIEADDDRVVFARTNVEKTIFLDVLSPSNTLVYEKLVSHRVNILNPSDCSLLDMFYLHAPHDIGKFQLFWNMNSKTYQTKGSLEIVVEPDYELHCVENDAKAGTESIEDQISTE